MNEENINKVIIWESGIPKLLDGQPIGGITVQTYFWAQVFARNGWQVYSFAEGAKKTISREGIAFRPSRNIKRINFLLEWWRALRYLLEIRPQVLIYRGANRHLLPLSFFSRLFGTRLVFFSASDVNFEPGKELVGSEFNRRLYQRSIKHIHFFVTQNRHQHDTLLQNYGKESLTMSNIWGEVEGTMNEKPLQSDAVWVANFRRLKRAEWVMDEADKLPGYRFAMAGARSGDGNYYEEMESRADEMENMAFLGARSFFYTNALVRRSRVLLCTSTFEGFPNTFLQAWSAGIPVISTVDPSGIIAANGLGEVVRTKEELTEALKRVLGDKEYYEKLCQSVREYFGKNHAAQAGYEKVMKYLDLDEEHKEQ